MKSLKNCKTKEEVYRYYYEKAIQNMVIKRLKEIVEKEDWKRSFEYEVKTQDGSK